MSATTTKQRAGVLLDDEKHEDNLNLDQSHVLRKSKDAMTQNTTNILPSNQKNISNDTFNPDSLEPEEPDADAIALASHPMTRMLQTIFISIAGKEWAAKLSHKTVGKDWMQAMLIRLFPSITAFQEHNSLLLSATCLFLFGINAGVCFGLMLSHPSWFRGCFFFMTISAWAFHEWSLTVLNHPDWKPDSRNFLIWHEPQMLLRAVTLAEYFLCSRFLFPNWFSSPLSIMIALLGVVVTVGARFGRSLAMATCATNFQFELRQQRSDRNSLVKTGFYSYIRHPSYSFVILYFIGQTLVMQAPISCLTTVALACASIVTRVVAEEHYLVKMYGNEYTQYQTETPALLPLALGGQVGPI